MGDIQAMFHQVKVAEQDRDFLRFLWWPEGDISRELKVYRMTVHLFGAVSSPSCASYALKKTADDNKEDFSELAVLAVKRNFYVDDCLMSLGSEEEAIKMVNELNALCKRGGFQLEKWISNSRAVLHSIPEEHWAKDLKELNLDQDDLPAERVLGLLWCVESDSFKFKMKMKHQSPTRCGMLSITSSLYNPLGFLSPAILPAKMMQQELCRRSCGWDDVIPLDILKRWEQWLEEVKLLASFKVARCMQTKDFGDLTYCQLHHFADASKDGYGTVTYIRLKTHLLQLIRQKAHLTDSDLNNGLVKRQRAAVTSKGNALKPKDLLEAELAIVRYCQQQRFEDEISCLLSKTGTGGRQSSIYKLDPILDNGLLRVGGRLSKGAMPMEEKHPLILSKDQHVSRLILKSIHQLLGHSGRNHTLSTLRRKYWITNANAAVRKIISECRNCRRFNRRALEQKMADLPKERLVPDMPPFTNVGVDYFGPVEIKQGRKQCKRYDVIFTCMTSRAIHLEVENSLETDACINAIRRFISRRGQVVHIRSDNGTNFVGTERELRKALVSLDHKRIQDALTPSGIEWSFNPPSASHYGGVWERMIRLVRRILNSVLRQQRLDDDGLHTVMCEIEAILNDCPITRLSDEPNDLEPLTPNHLLLLKGKPALPPGLFEPSDMYVKRRWRQV
ncbi:hypothetical protein CCH79_00018048 [Gambusia affinis]|uniref:Integrase catalytic domain-containing protein n=1 Tax=Gambusia affinis TaxID=33528 RepID=A0A315W9J7_GAMAF|nr:hypothetical protein CCH79_00018048 [Gambusia affinis]